MSLVSVGGAGDVSAGRIVVRPMRHLMSEAEAAPGMSPEDAVMVRGSVDPRYDTASGVTSVKAGTLTRAITLATDPKTLAPGVRTPEPTVATRAETEEPPAGSLQLMVKGSTTRAWAKTAEPSGLNAQLSPGRSTKLTPVMVTAVPESPWAVQPGLTVDTMGEPV